MWLRFYDIMDDYDDYAFSGIFRGKSRGILNDFVLWFLLAMVWLDQ